MQAERMRLCCYSFPMFKFPRVNNVHPLLIIHSLHQGATQCPSPIQYYLFMIDNFFQQSYHSVDAVYSDSLSAHRIFLGDVQSAMDGDFHLASQIRTVVTAALNMDHIIVGPGIIHVTYPLADAKQQNIAAFFERFYELVEERLKKGNILVHCAAGISRSATLVISYIMRKEKLPFKEAVAFVRKSRPSVLPNLGFERQLKHYEEKLRSGVKQSRGSRRSQVRTSQSGKSDGSQLLPLVASFFPGGRRLVDNFSEKDIQILRIYNNGRKNIIRNRVLPHRPKGMATLGERIVKTEVFDEKGEGLNILKRRGKGGDNLLGLGLMGSRLQKRADPLLKRLPSERGHTADHLKNR